MVPLVREKSFFTNILQNYLKYWPIKHNSVVIVPFVREKSLLQTKS